MATFDGLQRALDEYGRYSTADVGGKGRKIAGTHVAVEVLAHSPWSE
ncbi:hypothetical protein [Bifidobacterium aesculapii]|nr:hypothetical protein [Bifidobacterium aesculapii]